MRKYFFIYFLLKLTIVSKNIFFKFHGKMSIAVRVMVKRNFRIWNSFFCPSSTKPVGLIFETADLKVRLSV